MMKSFFLIFLFTILSVRAQAQQSPRDEYDVFAKFPQNQGDFSSYISAQVKQKIVAEADEKGTIKITITVDSLGKAAVFKMSSKLSPSTDSAFVSIISNSPTWLPARYRGHATSCYFTEAFDVEVVKTTRSVNIEKSERDKIFNSVETNPSFPGGGAALASFLSKTIRYPVEARERNVQGRVFVQFVVEPDGSLTNIQAISDPGAGLGDEGVRVLKLFPKWIPGKQKGVPVRVQYTVPINFSRI